MANNICLLLYFRHIGLVIMLDLSQPNHLWFTMESLLTSLRSRVEIIISQLKTSQPNIRDDLKSEMWERLGVDHPVSKVTF